ncbi:hypothetical protein [Roseibium salinum]|uniref:Uncharacterized protein n=1 Tax=Roseibium salinum TaxID=1604349 RepID=A0ABT3R207_9HYPH|nr:hypothetical protein [Roseibium sp. DSM 29163]MCX2723194.1 hypothetical protein [Roseibium sp. DSM 29163]
MLRLIVINGVAGIGIAGLVLGGLFGANIGNLRTLVLSADNPVLPLLMLAFGMVVTLGSVVVGSAIMLLGGNSSQGGRRSTQGMGNGKCSCGPCRWLPHAGARETNPDNGQNRPEPARSVKQARLCGQCAKCW